MSKITDRLSELGLELAAAKPVVANYFGSKRAGPLLFVSGRKSPQTGVVGRDLDLEAAKRAARDAVLDVLAIVEDDIGDLDRITSIVQVRGFVNSAEDFTSQPEVIDGASDLLIELWGEAGRHARTATGAGPLPYGASVQIDMVLEID